MTSPSNMNIARPAQAAPTIEDLALSFLKRMFGIGARAPLAPLYQAVVSEARHRFWYREGQVPDTMDGRFDMLSAVLALVLIRLEAEGEDGREPVRLLTERFVEDMDSTIRQLGIGDHLVGRHVGKMMGALGGRLAAFREGKGDFTPAVRRNVFHEAPPSEAVEALVARRLEALAARLDALPAETLLQGRLA